MAPPSRRRSILKQKNNDEETENLNFRTDPEESQWANVTQSARKRVSFSTKNQVKEFAKNCSSDNSNLSSDMDMTVCRERSMHEQNGDFDDDLQNSAMEISAAAASSSPESNPTVSSPHVFITPALKGTALSKSSNSFVTSTPAASSSPMLVTPKMAKRSQAEAIKITPISHPSPVEPDSVEKGRTIANQSMGHADMSVCEEPKRYDQDVDQSQRNARRKTTFEHADMSVCEEPKRFDQDTDQHQRNARRKTTFEHADMSVCEEPKNADQGTVQHKQNGRRQTTFEPADMSVCEEPKKVGQNTIPHHQNSRRKTTFESHDMSYEDQPEASTQIMHSHQQSSQMSMTFAHPGGDYTSSVHAQTDPKNSADRTKIFEMSMEMSFGAEESEPSPIQIQNSRAHQDMSTTNMSMTRIADATQNRSQTVAPNSQQPIRHDKLPHPMHLESEAAEAMPVTLPNSKVKVATKKKASTPSLGWLSDPAFAPKIYSKSTLATGRTAAAAAPSVPSVTHFGKFGCAKTPKRLIPMDLFSAEMPVAAHKTSPLNNANGPHSLRTSSPVAVIQPMNRTYVGTPPEASINLPPSQTLPWDTTCPLGGLLSGTRVANGFKPASPAPVNETFVVDPEPESPVENDNDNIFEPSMRFDGTIREEPENETSVSLMPKPSLTQCVVPSKSLQKTLAELHLTQGVTVPNVLQTTLRGQDHTQGVVIPGALQTTLPEQGETQGLAVFEPPQGIPAEETVAAPQDVAGNGMNESLSLHRPVPVQRKSSAEQLLEDMVQPEDLTQDLSFGSYVSFAAPPPLNGTRRPSRSVSPANSAESLFHSSVMDSPTSPQQPIFDPPVAAPGAAALPQIFGHSSRPHTHHHREPDPRYPIEVQNLLRIMMNSRGIRKMKAAEKLWRHPGVPLNLQADLYETLKQYLPSIFCSQDWRY